VYFHRIHRPTWLRSFTTAARFRAALAAHVSLYLFVLLVFHLVLRRILLSLGSSAAEEYAPVVIWVSLVITLCIRQFQRDHACG